MLNSISCFVNDYIDVCKYSMTFYEEHWVGMLIIGLIFLTIGFGGGYIAFKRHEKKTEVHIIDMSKFVSDDES